MRSEAWDAGCDHHGYVDQHGNRCERLTIAAGSSRIAECERLTRDADEAQHSPLVSPSDR